MRKLYWWSTSSLLKARTLVPPMAVARMVLVAATEISSPSPGLDTDPCFPTCSMRHVTRRHVTCCDNVMLTFCARNPNTRMRPPRAESGTECPGMLTFHMLHVTKSHIACDH